MALKAFTEYKNLTKKGGEEDKAMEKQLRDAAYSEDPDGFKLHPERGQHRQGEGADKTATSEHNA